MMKFIDKIREDDEVSEDNLNQMILTNGCQEVCLDAEYGICMSAKSYNQIRMKAKTPCIFVRKMFAFFFNEKELASSNYKSLKENSKEITESIISNFLL